MLSFSSFQKVMIFRCLHCDFGLRLNMSKIEVDESYDFLETGY